MRLTFAFVLFLLISSSKQENDNENLKKITPGFFYTMPKTLVSGKNETVCLSVHFASSLNAKVMIDLKIKEKHFFTTRTLESEHTCFELNVPNSTIKDPQFASVRIQIQLNGVIYSAHNQDPIVIYPSKKITFIETDRKFYKSEDKVKLRILTLSDNLLPEQGYRIPEVRIRNPLDISVAVWENLNTEFGLVQLEYQLPRDPTEGKWKIEVDGETQHFEVSKYDLPRFDVEIIHPHVIYYESSLVTFKVCSKYTYGGNVKGMAFIKLTDSHNNMQQIHKIKTMMDGCAQFTFTNDELSLNYIKKIYALMDPKIVLHITATVTEHKTDKIELATAKSVITLKPFHLKFANDNLFMPGLPYHGKLYLNNVHADLRGEVVEVCYNIAIKKSWNYLNNEQCSNFTLAGNEKSLDFHILPLRSSVIHLQLSARSLNHTNVGDSLLVVRLYSPSSSYIVIEQNHVEESSFCRSIQQFTIHYTTENLHEHENLTFYYMIKSRGRIHKLRKISHQVRQHYPNYLNDLKDIIGSKHKHVKPGSAIDKLVLKFKLDEKIISNYNLIVYYINPKGEIVAANKEITIEPCLNNYVIARWSHKHSSPGSRASLVVKTQPDSLCAISAVDKSTKIMSESQGLNIKSFMKPFLQEAEYPESSRKKCVAPERKRNKDASALLESEPLWDLRRKKRYIYEFSEDYDTYDIFNKFGAITITNFKIITKACYTGPRQVANNTVQFLTDQYDIHNEEKVAPIRSHFPETWLWELIPVKDFAIIHRILPHTITNWVTDVLCISASGGVAFSETTEISAFQPFFVDVLTPHSIKMGEDLYLHVTVFNYYNYNWPVRISLGDSPGLKLVDTKQPKIISYCIASNNTETHTFQFRGSQIGKTNITILAELDAGYPGDCGPDIIINKRDVVFKTLLIEPEGYPIVSTKSALICTSDKDISNNITWDLQIPENIVTEAAKAKIMINADLLGQTIENLDDLIEMPTGCGEQIMATMAPNLYVLRYLNATKTLTSSLHQKIVRNLKMGYKQILNYLHRDGSFSAFGYHDPAGSMFLTAFVVRTLQEAREFIYVDPRVIERAVAWIFEHQLENGCFSTMLHVFQDMGGTSTENSTAGLTAYVMISLLEGKIEVPENVKTNAKYCIRAHYHLDKYTLAISSYALLKVDWYSEAFRMLKKLDQLSNHKDDMLWWTNKDTNGSLATDIEITAYVLLSLLHQKTEENLVKAHSIVRWLSSKQSYKGSFKSTQDTVVALDALAKYSLFLNSKKLDLAVTVNAFNQNHSFRITNKDRLKNKIIQLKEVNNNIKISIEGDGCVLAQSVVSYYLKQLPTSDAFKLDMEIAPVSNIDKCSIASLTPCFLYNGPEMEANMAILEVALPSGYEADRTSLYKLLDGENKGNVKKFEEFNDKIVVYLTKLNKEQVCINFNINENAIVKSRAESTVKLYDYYKPEYNILQFYEIDESCKVNNLTMPEIINTSKVEAKEEVKNVMRRDLTGLNPDFVDQDEDLEFPDGIEGNQPVYIKFNASVDLNVSNSIDIHENISETESQLNLEFVDKNVDLDVPNAIESNVTLYTNPDSMNKKNGTIPMNKVKRQIEDFREELTTKIPNVNMSQYPHLNSSYVKNITDFYKNECKWWAHQMKRRKRRTTNNKLNPDFVNRDVDMQMPDGMEGTMPTYAKPDDKKKKC